MNAAFLQCVVVSKVKIQEHEDSRFGVDTEQRDQADPHGDTHVVVQQVQKPHSANGGERDGQQNDHGFDRRAGIEIQQQENDEQRDGNDQFQPLGYALHEFILSAPHQFV